MQEQAEEDVRAEDFVRLPVEAARVRREVHRARPRERRVRREAALRVRRDVRARPAADFRVRQALRRAFRQDRDTVRSPCARRGAGTREDTALRLPDVPAAMVAAGEDVSVLPRRLLLS